MVDPIVGGLRTRLIRDSYRNLIVNCLTELGWFDTDRRHKPIHVVDRPAKWDTPIATNGLVVSLESRRGEDAELGSIATIDTWTSYVDFYAESDDVGLALTGDVREILRGRFPALERTDPSFAIMDYTQATPVAVGTIQITNVMDDRARNFPNPWQAHWFVITANLEDEQD